MAAPPAGWAHARLIFNDQDISFGIGLDLLVPAASAMADLDTACADILSFFGSGPQLLLSTACKLVGCTMQQSDGTSVQEASATTAIFGASTGAQVPFNVALVTSWKIGAFYRGGKPRSYLGGIPESALDTPRVWNDAYLGDIETAMQSFHDQINGIVEGSVTFLTHGVWHKRRAGVVLRPWTFDPITGSAVQKRVCSQRRRTGPTLHD